jgi:hypothetical protein
MLLCREPERSEWGGPCPLLKLGQMGTQRVQMKGGLPLVVRWARRAGKREVYPALAALVSPVQNSFSSPCTTSIYVSPSSQQPGQAVVQGRLSLNVCLHKEQMLVHCTNFQLFSCQSIDK